MSIKSVWGSVVEIKFDTTWKSGFFYLSVKFVWIFDSAEFIQAIILAIHSFDGHNRIQFERLPDYLDIFSVEFFNRKLEAFFADKTPGADYVWINL